MSYLLAQANALRIPLADKSVHMCVTSPPYWSLRDYGTAQWVGGDSECDHKRDSFAPKEHIGSDGKIGRNNTNWDHRNEAHYRDTCGKCGARRIDNQLGLEPTPDEFIRTMVEVFREVWRVLRDDGTCWVNMGDSYAQGGRGGNNTEFTGSVYREEMAGIPKKAPPGLKPKDLVGIPWRLAFALQADGADTKTCAAIQRAAREILDAFDGETVPDRVMNVIERLQAEYREAKGNSWYLRSDIIWAKPNPMPESVTDRPTKSHEYLFLLSKQERYYFDSDAVRTENVTGLRDREKFNGESAVETKERGWGSHCGTYEAGRNIRTVWSIPTESYPGSHFATYPRKLVEPCIKAGTSEKGCCPVCGAGWVREVDKELIATRGIVRDGGTVPHKPTNPRNDPLDAGSTWGHTGGVYGRYNVTTTGWRSGCSHDAAPVPAVVLDPFVGSGTSIVVANALGRRGIGLDLSREYLGLAQRRIARPHAKIPRPEREGNSRDLPGQLRMF